MADDDVLDFYETWLEFSTKQTFAWCDEYPEHQAANRYERRAMAAENSKIRLEKKKSFNITVRLLVKHVRTLDPRVSSALLRKKNAREEKLRATAAKREEKRRIAYANMQANLEAASESPSEEESMDHYADLLWEQRSKSQNIRESNATVNKPMEVIDALSDLKIEAVDTEAGPECVPCGKTFKTEKELAAHTKTSKHRQMVKSMGGSR